MSHGMECLDKPKDECGVFGIYGSGENVSRITYFGRMPYSTGARRVRAWQFPTARISRSIKAWAW